MIILIAIGISGASWSVFLSEPRRDSIACSGDVEYESGRGPHSDCYQ